MAMQRRPNQSIWIFRWILSALALVLCVALIARGDVLIGVLFGAFTIVRTAMFITWRRRIRERGLRETDYGG